MVNLKDMGRLLHLLFHVMLKPCMRVSFHHILYRKFLPPRPADDRLRHLDALLIRERDGQRKRFIWSQGPIVGESPPSRGEIPHRALSLEWSCVVRDGALRRDAAVGMNQENHRGGSKEKGHFRRVAW